MEHHIPCQFLVILVKGRIHEFNGPHLGDFKFQSFFENLEIRHS